MEVSEFTNQQLEDGIIKAEADGHADIELALRRALATRGPNEEMTSTENIAAGLRSRQEGSK